MKVNFVDTETASLLLYFVFFEWKPISEKLTLGVEFPIILPKMNQSKLVWLAYRC